MLSVLEVMLFELETILKIMEKPLKIGKMIAL
jgi:hypothetical protein